MTKEEFVNIVHKVIYESAIRGAISNLENPPGRKPGQRLVTLSKWFNNLSPEDKEHVRAAVQSGVHAAVFSFLAVLDGVRVIDDYPEHGELELRYVRNGESVLINEFRSGEFLHDLFNGIPGVLE